MFQLLSRDEFRNAVFHRDNTSCVCCKEPAKDAHHIIERRLWPDGGYYLANGASVCEACHLKAESTEISCDQLRTACGIKRTILPPHLYGDQLYDKWGNEILPNGQRLRGELFHDESVQKVLKPVMHLFTDRVKYPRTYHLPWSPGVKKDDRVWDQKVLDRFNSEKPEVVVTVKMDGENTTMYSDYMHARSLEYESHPSRSRAKVLQATIGYNIPNGWRICLENLYAVHSIRYFNLPGYELLFSVWNDKNECLNWDATIEWAELLELPVVPVLYRGPWDQKLVQSLYSGQHNDDECEGYVVRPTNTFHYREFRSVVGKYVRKDHVQTHGGWMRRTIEANGVI